MLLLFPFAGLGLGLSTPNSDAPRLAPMELGEPKDERLAPFIAF